MIRYTGVPWDSDAAVDQGVSRWAADVEDTRGGTFGVGTRTRDGLPAIFTREPGSQQLGLDPIDAFLSFSQPRAVGCNAFPVGGGRGGGVPHQAGSVE